jgi:hypothetical protein
MGDVSYGATSMIWSTFDQFALSTRYTKMIMKQGSLKAIANYGLTGLYLGGSVITFGTAAVIKPMKKGVAGANYALTYSGSIGGSLMLFYTRPIPINRRWTVSPDIYLSGLNTDWSEGTVSKDINVLTGANIDMALTKRFKANFGIKIGGSSNLELPKMYMLMIGTKMNL